MRFTEDARPIQAPKQFLGDAFFLFPLLGNMKKHENILMLSRHRQGVDRFFLTPRVYWILGLDKS